MKKVIVNGADENNKVLRKTIYVDIVNEKDICEKAFKNGFYYVNSYRYAGVTIKCY